MKTFFTRLFVGLGVVFVLQLIFLAYLYFADPYNLKPLLFPQSVNKTQESSRVDNNNSTTEALGDAGSTENHSDSSNVSSDQAKALESVGVSPDSVPQSFTAAEQACFESILGVERVNQIKAGDTPSLSEFYAARKCLE